MSHVDDGELTAYADGAYTPGDADAQRIELHLAECVNCRNRLAQAQALSGRASEILAVAAPATFSVPGFDTVQAAARPRRRMPAIPMTWAATVLLAAGLGWFGRDAMLEQQAATEVARPAITEPQSGAPFTADQAAPPSVAPGVTAPAPAPSPAPRRQRALEQAAGGSVAGAGAVTGNALELAEVKAAVMEAPAPATQAESRTAAARAGAPPRPAALPLQHENIEYVTLAEAERRNITLHRVPELEVVRVGLLDDAVRIEQKLPDGRIITLNTSVVDARALVPRDVVSSKNMVSTEQRREEKPREADLAAQVGAAASRVSVTITRGSTRITLTGVLSADSLRALSAKVR